MYSKATPSFFNFFEEHIQLKNIIPKSVKQKYYSTVGSKRKYSLTSMIKFFILKNIFAIQTFSTLLRFLYISKELRDFCGFEVYVKENNPKFYSNLIRISKKFGKSNKIENFNPEKYAQSQFPKYASSNPEIHLSYLNSHFGFFVKSNIVTDGLGIIRHIDFYDEEMNFSLNPNSAKYKYDSKTLIPVLENYFSLHPEYKYKYFLGDTGFDSSDNYEYLIEDRNMIPIIPLNPRNRSNLPKPNFTTEGIPTCPNDPKLEMKFDGITR